MLCYLHLPPEVRLNFAFFRSNNVSLVNIEPYELLNPKLDEAGSKINFQIIQNYFKKGHIEMVCILERNKSSNPWDTAHVKSVHLKRLINMKFFLFVQDKKKGALGSISLLVNLPLLPQIACFYHEKNIKMLFNFY